MSTLAAAIRVAVQVAVAALVATPSSRAGADRGASVRPITPVVPAPLVSRGKRVVSRPSGGEVVVDGVYRTKASWAGGRPSPERPSWVAIEIGAGYSRLILSWTSSGNHDYTDRKFGAPVAYRIETSGDSTDGMNGTWRPVVQVSDNPVRTRAHSFGFAGQRWVRLAVTALSPDVFEWGLYIDEIEVHDLSHGGDDLWVFFGDSITSGVFDRAPEHQPGFPETIAARHPGYDPLAVSAGFGSLHHSDAVRRIEQVLALNPDARFVALSFGSNDWDPVAYRKDLLEVVHKVRATGKIPIVPRIPARSDAKIDFQARLNAVIDEVTRTERLLPGPDLYGYFCTHPERLMDGLHPDAAGAVDVIRLWAAAVAPLYRR